MTAAKATKPRKPRGYRPLPADAPATEAPPAKGSVIGDNNPPADDPFALMTKTIDDWYEEATNWLDGDPISNEDQAEQVTKLAATLTAAAKTADAERTKEKAPHLEAGRAVDAKWKPLIDKAEKAARVAKNALTPWLQAVEAEKRRIAEEEAKRAREAEEELRRAHEEQQRSETLDEAAEAELAEREREAEDARRAASAARKDTATVRTDAGKVSLRTYWFVNITDRRALLRYYLEADPEGVEAYLRERAEKDVRSGANRNLPGCSIWSERRAV